MKSLLKHLIPSRQALIPNVGALLVLGLIVVAHAASAVFGAAPDAPEAPATVIISYQGTLTNPAGTPIEGTVTMKFALYDAASGGNVVWGPETQSVDVDTGLFHVLLGSVQSIDPAALIGNLYLDITVNGERLLPREWLVSSVAKTLTVSGNGTALIEGDLQVGENAWTPTFAGMDGNDLAVRGQFEQSGSGGARVYKLGIGTDPGTSAGTLKMGGTLNMNDNDIANVDGIKLPFKLESDRSWEFRTYESGATTKTALRSTVDDKFFQFRNQNGSVILSIRADNESGGYLDVNGHTIRNCGALVEANLQTAEELAAERIDRFAQGDVLCWGDGQLEKCAEAGDPLVQAVADVDGRPIVIGAELIRVIGPVQRGDFLVASEIPGYAMASGGPRFGTVIAQAMESFDGERGMIRAMIRKM